MFGWIIQDFLLFSIPKLIPEVNDKKVSENKEVWVFCIQGNRFADLKLNADTAIVIVLVFCNCKHQTSSLTAIISAYINLFLNKVLAWGVTLMYPEQKSNESNVTDSYAFPCNQALTYSFPSWFSSSYLSGSRDPKRSQEQGQNNLWSQTSPQILNKNIKI